MNQERVFKVLLGPHISEKATVLDVYKRQLRPRVPDRNP